MIKCPNCGATINQPGQIVRCDYCGTQVRVQRRTGFFERVEPPPKAPPNIHMPLVVQKHSSRWVMLSVLSPMLIMGVVGAGIFFASGAAKRAQRAVQSQLDTPRWDGSHIGFFTDIDGDEVDDIVGRVFPRTSNAESRLAAFSGASGKRIWQSGTLGVRSGVLGTASALVAGKVLISNDSGEIFAIDVSNGELLWKVRFAERTKRFCGDGDAHVFAELKDKTWQRLKLADGTFSKSESGRCTLLETDNPRERRPSHFSLEWHNGGPDSNAIEGMSISQGIRGPRGVYIANGTKSPGTRSPMIARYDLEPMDQGPEDVAALQAEADKKKGRERSRLLREKRALERKLEKRELLVKWKALVPGIDPLQADEGAVDAHHVAIGDSVVAVTYEVENQNHDYRLAVFDLETGKRVFDTPLPKPARGSSTLSATAISNHSAFVATWNGFFAFDLKTGKRRYKID